MHPILRYTLPALCACALLAACQRTPAPTTTDTTTPARAAPAQTPAVANADLSTDVISEVDDSSSPVGVDVKTFAGTFKGMLPCGDCPGINMVLTLQADGTGTQRMTYRERHNDTEETGTWTVDNDGKQLRFDPDSKQQTDSLYAIDGNDRLLPLDGDGHPLPRQFVLTR